MNRYLSVLILRWNMVSKFLLRDIPRSANCGEYVSMCDKYTIVEETKMLTWERKNKWRSASWTFDWLPWTYTAGEDVSNTYICLSKEETYTFLCTYQEKWKSASGLFQSSPEDIFVCISMYTKYVIVYILDICHFFSTHAIFGYFFSTQKRLNRDKTNLRQKCVNCNKTNFTTKKHEFYTCGGILHITHMPDVDKFQIYPHLSCNFSTWQIFLHTPH